MTAPITHTKLSISVLIISYQNNKTDSFLFSIELGLGLGLANVWKEMHFIFTKAVSLSSIFWNESVHHTKTILVWLLLYAHRHQSILGMAGQIVLTPANQLMVMGLKIWSLSSVQSGFEPASFRLLAHVLTNCSNYQYWSDLISYRNNRVVLSLSCP
jgi:hypothetical protein